METRHVDCWFEPKYFVSKTKVAPITSIKSCSHTKFVDKGEMVTTAEKHAINKGVTKLCDHKNWHFPLRNIFISTKAHGQIGQCTYETDDD